MAKKKQDKPLKNVRKTIDKEKYLDANGKFKEGNPGGPGRPEGRKNYLTLLEEALEREAKKAGKTYWEKLAEWCFIRPDMASAILKKFLPDKNSTELAAGSEPVQIKIIRDSNDKGS